MNPTVMDWILLLIAGILVIICVAQGRRLELHSRNFSAQLKLNESLVKDVMLLKATLHGVLGAPITTITMPSQAEETQMKSKNVPFRFVEEGEEDPLRGLPKRYG